MAAAGKYAHALSTAPVHVRQHITHPEADIHLILTKTYDVMHSVNVAVGSCFGELH